MFKLILEGPDDERLEVEYSDENEVGPAMERLGRLLRAAGWSRGFAIMGNAILQENERRQRIARNGRR